MIKKKRGRPKGSKKTIKQKKNMTKLVKKFKKGEPTNYVFWKGMLKDNKVQEFIDRGNIEQKLTIKRCLIFLKVDDSEIFEEVDGQNLLKQLKKGN